MAGRVRVAGVDRRIQGLDRLERILFEDRVRLGELGRSARERVGLPTKRPGRGPDEHGQGEIEDEEDQRYGGPDRMLVLGDQVLASPRVSVDLVRTDCPRMCRVFDWRVDLEQTAEAQAPLDLVLFDIRHL